MIGETANEQKSLFNIALGRRLQRWPSWVPLVAVLVLVMPLHLISLMRFPQPFVDEAWLASRAWSFVGTGHAFGTLDAGVFDRFEGYWTLFSWFEALFRSLSIRAFGLSLFSMRLTSLISGLVLLVAIYVIARRLGGQRMALIAVVLVALSRGFFLSAHLARHDIMVAALGFGAVALSLIDRESPFPLKSILSGLALALAFEMHPNGAIYGPVILALYLNDHGWSIFRSRRFWGFAGGVLVGLSLYAAIHIFPYPATYTAFINLAYGASRTPLFLVTDPNVWLGNLGSMGTLFLGFVTTATPLVVIGVWLLWARRSADDQRLLVLFIVLMLAFTVLVRNKFSYYAILFSPGAALVLAAFVTRLLSARWPSSLLARGEMALAWGLLLGAVVSSLTCMRGDLVSDYEAVLDRIRQVVPADSVVMGTQVTWFAIPNQRYLSWEQLIYYQRYAPGSTLEDALTEFHPDFLIMDSQMAHFIVDDQAELSEYDQNLYLPKPDFNRFLEQRASLINTIDSESLGSIWIYKIDWTREARSLSVGPERGFSLPWLDIVPRA